ncbi:MAG: PAM68 family protein [Cyanophyceae cyanobacterium]
MASKSNREQLPFEPRRKKTAKQSVTPKAQPVSPRRSRRQEASLSAIPDAVSKRMVRRMALFSGVPTALGVASLVVCYWIVSHQWFKIPNVAALLVSMGFFGLGVLGLSYGIISTSWDEERVGSWLGGEEFSLNFGRLISAWRNSRQEQKAKSDS